MADIWSLITGLASILSLVLYYVDRFPDYKRHLGMVTSFLVGFTFSRVVYAALPSTTSTLSLIPMLMGALVFAVLGFVLYLFGKKEMQLGWLVLLFFIQPLFYAIRDAISAPTIPAGDYLILAREKEKTADFSGAINYFEMYLKLTRDHAADTDVRQHITELNKTELNHALAK